MAKMTKAQIALDRFREKIATSSNGVVMVNCNGCWSIRGEAYGFPDIADSTRDAWLAKYCRPFTPHELGHHIAKLERNAARYARAIHKFVDCGNFEDAQIACERAEACIRWTGGQGSRWYRYYKLKPKGFNDSKFDLAWEKKQ